MTYVIIGGDAAGMSTASRIARKKKDAQVIVFEKTDIVSYGACGLPYYIGGVNDDIELVKIRSPEEFRAGGVDLRLWHEVTSVDFDAKTVNVKNLKSGEEFVQSYDKLLIAAGSRPIVPPVEGRELQGVYVLKTIPEAETIKAALLKDEAKPQNTVCAPLLKPSPCAAERPCSSSPCPTSWAATTSSSRRPWRITSASTAWSSTSARPSAA